MKKRYMSALAVTASLSVGLVGCGTSTSGGGNTNKGSSGTSATAAKMPKHLTIAAQNYSEPLIDDYIIKDLIEAKTPIKVIVKQTSGASQLMHSMLTKGSIQIYTSYDGTEFQEIFKKSYAGKYFGHPKLVASYVKNQEMKQFGVWVSPSLGYEDPGAIAVTAATAQKYNLKTIPDLAKISKNMVLGTDQTWAHIKHTGLKAFEKTYNIQFKSVKTMAYDLIYEALHKNAVQAVYAYGTDGRLKKLNEVTLKDAKHFFPPYHAFVLIKDSVVKSAHLDKVLSPLWGAITTADQENMNYQVDVLKKTPSKVAHAFLVKKGLISS